MTDETVEWGNAFCPEMNEGLHEPKAVKLLPEVSPGQTEVEILVRCKFCGEEGLSTLLLDPEKTVSYTHPKETS